MPGPVSRITGGELAGRVLRVTSRPPHGFRPSAARLREALFNVLGGSVRGARVLDLYAGSGIVGFEALSRGAASVTFVEASAGLARSIESNAVSLDVSSRIRMVRGRLPGALESVGGPFDLVYMDPPYAETDMQSAFSMLESRIAAGARVVYEHSSRYNPPERPPGLEMEQRRIYGDSAIALYRSSESE